MKREKAEEFLTELPRKGESMHIISNGSFDYWNFCPIIIDLLGGKVKEFFGSTWTLNRQNALELLELYDNGAIGSIGFLTGLYFKRRESAVYATIYEGLRDRGQKYKCLENHSKIMLFTNGIDYIVTEGSANFTANPRIEQNVITNNKELYKLS